MKNDSWRLLEDHFSDWPSRRAKPVNEPELDFAIQEVGFPQVAEDFREFILRYGAAEVGVYPIYGLSKTQSMAKSDGTFVDMTKRFRELEWPGAENWIIISMDQSGNPIGLAEDGSVWISDTDFNEILRIAENFEEFLVNECLKEDEEDDWDDDDVQEEERESTEPMGGISNYSSTEMKVDELSHEVLEMVRIPAGVFQMGSTKGRKDEMPVHQVRLSAFKMAKCPVTWAQWLSVKKWAEAHGYDFILEGKMGGGGLQTNERHPVTTMNWHDTIKWCNALSEMEGRIPCYYSDEDHKVVYRSGKVDYKDEWVVWDTNGYRLPTEAEWEYTCRAGTVTAYHFGNTINKQDANYESEGTTPVGIYKPNAWGLYDMHGNVGEFCWDVYDKNYYRNSPLDNPKGPIGKGSRTTMRVFRGYGWQFGADDIRSSVRDEILTAAAQDFIGFRTVCAMTGM